MGQEKTEATGGNFVDLFKIDHAKYQDTAAVEEVTEEVVDTNKGLDTINQDDEDKDEVKDVTEVVDEGGEEGEPSDNGAEKQAENEEDADDKVEDAKGEGSGEESKASKEDASADDGDTGVVNLMQDLIDNDVLLFDEEKEYEPSKEGLQALLEETVEKKVQETLSKQKEELPQEAGQLLDILQKGGSVEDFVNMNQQIDFSEIDTGNPTNQGYLVEDWMKVQGYDDNEIQERVKDLSEAGLLEKEARISQRKLVSHQDKQNAETIKKLEESQSEQAARDAADAEKFKQDVLNTREIAKFKVTAAKAQKLYDFITQPEKDGTTAFKKADNEENRLLYALFAMEGFDKNALSKEVARTQTIKLKKKLSNYQDSNAKPARSGKEMRRDDDAPKISWNFGATK